MRRAHFNAFSRLCSLGLMALGLTGCFADRSAGNTRPTNPLQTAPTSTPPPQLFPAGANVEINESRTFVVAGGSAPYTFEVTAGSGSIDEDGVYTASGTPGTEFIKVTDAAGKSHQAVVVVYVTLAITPAAPNLIIGAQTTFAGQFGMGTYSYSLTAGGGTLDPVTGVYTASAAPGLATVRVTDSEGNTADASVTIANPVTITPTTKNLLVNANQMFGSTGGFNPKTYTIQSGGGSIVAGTGSFTAPGIPGTTVVRVTDSAGNYAEATVTTAADLTISPTAKNLLVNAIQAFGSTGGFDPKTYTIQSGGGSIDAGTGSFTAPAAPDTTVVRVTDNEGHFVEATVITAAALTISPPSKNLIVNANQVFSSTGGFNPKTYTIQSGGGSIVAGTGSFTAPAAPDTTVVRVTDNEGHFVEATVITANVVTITPTTRNLMLGNSGSFTGGGGFAPYTYSVIAPGVGTVNATSGLYTAPGALGPNETVRVTDSEGNTADAVVTLFEQLVISPTSGDVTSARTIDFSHTGGIAPFTYSIQSGPGSIDPASGVYTASTTGGAVTVRVTDSIGNIADAQITAHAAVELALGGAHACVRFDTGRVKCWGRNNYGQLGLGDANSRGDASGEMGANLPFLDFGSGRTATALSAGAEHTCALLDDGKLKCWGRGTNGRRGSEDTVAYGDQSNETLAALNEVLLGNNRSAIKFSAGPASTCAVLDDGTLKCFGEGNTGRHGRDSNTDYGHTIDTMGDNLPTALQVSSAAEVVTFGTAATNGTTCVRSTAGEVRCFGHNLYGQVGREVAGAGATTSIGDAAGEMATYNANALALGTGLSAVQLSAGTSHVCALLDDGSVKCWGRRDNGRLGTLTYYSDHRGDAASEMGDDLDAVHLGSSAIAVASGVASSCAILTDGSVKCWGAGTNGVRGSGNTAAMGDATNEMNTLTAVQLGTGRTALAIAMSNELTGAEPFTCAILDDRSVKCWGGNNYGQLGINDLVTYPAARGDAGGEMGDALPIVEL